MLRNVCLLLIRYTGLLWLWRWRHRNSITIVMLHGVMDTDVPTRWEPLRPQLSRNRLDRCLQELGKRYRFATIDEAAAMLDGTIPVRPRTLVVTLDDGYRNQLRHAVPLLRKHGAPCIIYLSAGHIDQRKPFWFDRLDFAVQSVGIDRRTVRVGSADVAIQGASRNELRRSCRQIYETAWAEGRPDTETVAAIEDVAAGLERESGRSLQQVFEDDDWSAVLTWPEVADAASAFVRFGAHTMDHVRLTRVHHGIAYEQCTESKRRIGQSTGVACDHFCYPYGSFDDKVANIVSAAGYRTAVTSEEGLNEVGTDLLRLRRIHIDTDGSTTEILSKVAGCSRAIARLKSKLRKPLGRKTVAGILGSAHNDIATT
jgi:peptidoglycan/xylan/chitin deacetylase (PgdA/CDA1 family)